MTDKRPGIPRRIAARSFVNSQYLLPHHHLSRTIHWLTRVEQQQLSQLAIRGFSRAMNIDLSEAERDQAQDYASFNAFFTRSLKNDARPLATTDLVCPVDGTVSQLGRIRGGRIFQAKGREFSTNELLGDDMDWAPRFSDGEFATLYLAPNNYHRIHMPLNGQLKRMIHVPGRLFSVNPTTANRVPRLFARNERIVTLWETDAGPMAMVLVGALFVASIETIWAGQVTPPAGSHLQSWDYPQTGQADISIDRGLEMGRFNMGSTVILLFSENAISWAENLQPGTPVQMGQALANQS